jgi:NitT/TauT family transport system permease protein
MTRDKVHKKVNKYKVLAVFFWIAVWQIASMIVGEEMLLASPFAVIGALVELAGKLMFWKSIFNSFIKITGGFLLAILFGTLFAVCSYGSYIFYEMITPLIKIVKTTPVVSFIILVLLWANPENLSVVIAFLMVIPVIYTNVMQGLNNTDVKLLEMAKVFRIGWLKKARYIYIPAVMPYFASACSVGLGFCWKSGIAAEVIGLPKNSIGENLYEAKLNLMTKELFAWTFVIICISVIFEKMVMKLLKQSQNILSENEKVNIK